VDLINKRKILQSILQYRGCFSAFLSIFFCSSIFSDSFLFQSDRKHGSIDQGYEYWQGHVVAISSQVFITADKIEYNRQKEQLIAEGHVLFLTRKDVMTATKLLLDLSTKDFLAREVLFIHHDEVTIKKLKDRILGFTKQEMDFEKGRKDLLIKIRNKKLSIKGKFPDTKQEKREEWIKRYTQLLFQEHAVQQQPNPYFFPYHQDHQKHYRLRREFWKKSRANSKKQPSFYPNFTIRLKGQKLQRVRQNDYYGTNISLSTCQCGLHEEPDWSIQAKHFFMQKQGYASFQHALITIKGFPVFYLPYFKIPVKNKRQSGFLVPKVTSTPRSGKSLSLPLFFTLGNHADMTLYPTYYSLLGMKMGTEFRWLQDKYMGWQFHAEWLHDKEWNQSLENRKIMHTLYQERSKISTQSKTSTTKSLKNCLEETSDIVCPENTFIENLEIPSNRWRYKIAWKGGYSLSPQISLVSAGELPSDHQYNRDFSKNDSFGALLQPDKDFAAPILNQVQSRLHIDTTNFYLSFANHYADNVTLPGFYTGLQMPLEGYVSTRFFDLGLLEPFNQGFYGQLTYRVQKIDEWRNVENLLAMDESLEPSNPDEVRSLGDTYYHQLTYQMLAPIAVKNLISIDNLTQFDFKYINFAHDQYKDTQIASVSNRLTFKLPLRAEMPLSNLKLQHGNISTIEHLMNWQMVFFLRPFVERNGDYLGTQGDLLKGLTYFASDHQDESNMPEDIMMRKSKKITFSTNHTWSFFSRHWQHQPKESRYEYPDQLSKPTFESRRKQARKELISTIKGQVESLDKDPVEILSNPPYHLIKEDKHLELVQLNSEISYDLKAKHHNIRKQPWSLLKSDISVSFSSWVFRYAQQYDLYKNLRKEKSFTLDFPKKWGIQFSTGYTLGKTSYDKNSNSYQNTRTITYSIHTTFIPSISSNFYYKKKKQIESQKKEVKTVYSFIYQPNSSCWEVILGRYKDFGKREKEAKYHLTFALLFANQRAELPDFSNIFLKMIGKHPNK